MADVGTNRFWSVISPVFHGWTFIFFAFNAPHGCFCPSSAARVGEGGGEGRKRGPPRSSRSRGGGDPHGRRQRLPGQRTHRPHRGHQAGQRRQRGGVLPGEERHHQRRGGAEPGPGGVGGQRGLHLHRQLHAGPGREQRGGGRAGGAGLAVRAAGAAGGGAAGGAAGAVLVSVLPPHVLLLRALPVLPAALLLPRGPVLRRQSRHVGGGTEYLWGGSLPHPGAHRNGAHWERLQWGVSWGSQLSGAAAPRW